MLQRRAFLGGLLALVSAPAIVRAGSLMPVRQMLLSPVSMRNLIDYVPGDQVITRLDVLYGSLKLGDVVTWESDAPESLLRQFVVTNIAATRERRLSNLSGCAA